MQEKRHQHFYANIKWFEPAEQPDSIDDLPEVIREAQALCQRGCQAEANGLLSAHITALFLPQNIAEYAELFDLDPDDDFPEFSAIGVRVVGADFSAGPLPMIKSEAVFHLPVTSVFGDLDLADWEEQHCPLTDCVAFSWQFDDEITEDLDLSMGDHQGIECIPVDASPFA